MSKHLINTLAPNEISKLNHIDLLRGLAVVMVIITHIAFTDINISEETRSILTYGAHGVQLFFFLSAYTLCRSMDSRKEAGNLKHFYIRRFFRIAPLYYTGILIYWIVSLIPEINLNGPLSHNENYTPLNVVSNVLFLNSFNINGYNNIVPGGWSIGTEMFFYLCFPFVYMIYERVKENYVYLILPLLTLLLANVYMILGYLVFKDVIYTSLFFYGFLPNQMPVFLLGMSYYFLEKKNLLKASALTSALLFMILFVSSFLIFRTLRHNINIYIFVAAISFAFLFQVFKKVNFEFYSLSRIGQLSFSIYLFHFLFAYPLSYKVSTLLAGHVGTLGVFLINVFLSLILSVLISIFSERYIEKPGINLGRSLIKVMREKSEA